MSDEEVNKFLRSRLKNIDNLTTKKLKLILNQNRCWESVVASIPSSFSNKITDNLINEKVRLLNVTPADVLFNEFYKRNTRVLDVIPWFERAYLDQALMLLKPDEPLEIVIQPPKTCHVRKELILTCKAKGFPTPKYQWYKDRMELLEQTFSDLNIKEITTDHKGIYYCKVYNIDRLTNEEKTQHILSSETLVSVEEKKPEILKIKWHPVAPCKKVKQGSTITLKCEAECGSSPVKYQWYQNGIEMAGETKSDLLLDNLYKNPIDGVSQWYYTCKAYTEDSSIMSKQALIMLDKPDDETQYYAQRKLALLIGNQEYLNLYKLKLPSADVVTLSLILEEKGFTIFSFQNLTLNEMRSVVTKFVEFVEEGDYVIFYFAGHGFEEFEHYMVPVDGGRDYLAIESLSIENVLEQIQRKNPALAFMLVDMCRAQLDRETTVTLHPTDSIKNNIASNTLKAFATSPGGNAIEHPNRMNGVFVEHLMKYLGNQRFIVDILFDVKRDMGLLKQSPWTSGNLSNKLTLDDPSLATSRPKIDALFADFDHNLRERHLDFDGYNVRMLLRKHDKVFLNAVDVDIYVEPLHREQKEPLLMVTLRDQGITIPANQRVKILPEKRSETRNRYRIINTQRLQKELIIIVALIGGAKNQVQPINLGKTLFARDDV